jgi:hypothetical protein
MMKKAGQLTPDQIQAAQKLLYSPVMYALYGVMGVVMTFFAMVVTSLIILGLLRMFGNEGKYSRIIAVYSLAYIPQAIGSILKGIYMLITQKPIFTDLSPTFMSTLLNQIDLFILWTAILVVVGISKVFGLSEKKSIIIAVTLWLLTLGISLLPVLMKPAA